ncbi:hypothetical protein BE20_00295 [Sorangium cellulosum]|uniref:Uncharacterized protein n=1 Tax=Sorangium cellulosum TaxID=56 RepID=A0A150S3D3_SORCE|nr:hypothetical protein BE18_04295 [Sorangium cellulosum]KYF86846.1 hypothetical protein BE20_00295 [Sorangium cellulosum]
MPAVPSAPSASTNGLAERTTFPGALVSCGTQLFVTDSEGPLVMSFCGLFPQNTPLESVTLHVSEYCVNASAAPAGDWLSENEPLMILAIGQS